MKPIHHASAAVFALASMLLTSCGGGDGGNTSAASLPAQPVPAEIASILQKPVYRDARWALRVVDLDTGRVIHDLGAGQQMLIGSVRKLFSVGLALEALGPEHVVRTPV